MQIILKVRTRFALYEETTVNKPDGPETAKSVTNTVTLAPSTLPQIAPDWISNDPLFALLVKDGSLIQISAGTQIEAPTTTASAETATGDSGKKGRK